MYYLFTILVSLFVLSCQSKNTQEILLDAKNENIHYIGRIDSSKKFVEFAYSGVEIVFTLKGNKCILEFSDFESLLEQANYVSVEINQNVRTVLCLKPGKNNYDISEYCTQDTNRIAIFKNTEAQVGVIGFHGIKTSSSSKLIRTQLPSKKILWIGNSITCGYGNMLSIEAPPKGNPSTGFHSQNENNYLAWGSICSRKLNTQAMQVCYSGIGIYRNHNGDTINTLPNIFNRIIPTEEQSNLWLHKNYEPDLIVIELGTNDFALEAQNPILFCDSISFINEYKAFVKNLKKLHPQAKIICVVGNMLSNTYPKNLNRLNRCRSYVKAVVQNFTPDDLIYFFELQTQHPPYGENWHPTMQTHEQMSKQILPFIAEIMSWK